ncbi:hypothetical protein BUALT_Bualt10G0007100 [Buddleja alternifolia]|uniref:DDE Tnp4 domain-containing protein n=1 Tax=Buddleja alternifolia TaxID=168488 RepID=A0AAV6X5W4_9LAMI|nr:hypothetical protein BUALT_Bualt10G0007100 [Buddleja alternifolia]
MTPKPMDDECTVARWKSFKGCLGALDGTYIDVHTPLLDKTRYRNHKGGISVNVLGVVDCNMDFMYLLPCWDGSIADGRSCVMVLTGQTDLKSPMSEGCRSPQNAKELYNQRHTRARNVIERTWGIMKWKWAVLRSASSYPLRPQNQMILSCALLHNFIRREMKVDSVEAHVKDLDRNHWNRYSDDQPEETEIPEEDVLVQSLKEIISTGWKADNGFHIGYLNVPQDKIMKAFPCIDLRANPHISSKMHSWKK